MAVLVTREHATMAEGDSKMRRLSFVMAAIFSVLVSTPRETPAQTSLAFSKDGRVVYEVLLRDPVTLDPSADVRAISYNAATGKQLRTFDLGDTWFFSAATDGRFGVISVDRDPKKARTRVLLVDLETGRRQELPSTWFDKGDRDRYAQLSGDGRLVSAYSEDQSEGTEVVSVYNWRTKKLVAKQSRDHSAGGFGRPVRNVTNGTHFCCPMFPSPTRWLC